MRPLFLFLVLINLGYFAWQWQQQSDVAPPPSGPIAVAPHSKTLTLLSETAPDKGKDSDNKQTQQPTPSNGGP